VFVVKKLVSRLLFPLPLVLLLSAVGMLLLWLRRREGLAKTLLASSALLLLTLSTDPISTALVRPLEETYPPLADEAAAEQALADVAYVVVLSSGIRSPEGVPAQRQLSAHSQARLIEGARVYGLCGNAKVILSGGYGIRAGTPDDELTGYRMMVQLGVPQDDIMTQLGSDDTDDEARNIAPLVRDSRFVLVTSASHLPRAVSLFRAQGADPVPAPCDYWYNPYGIRTAVSLYPNAEALGRSERAIYEYLGLAYAWLRGYI